MPGRIKCLITNCIIRNNSNGLIIWSFFFLVQNFVNIERVTTKIKLQIELTWSLISDPTISMEALAEPQSRFLPSIIPRTRKSKNCSLLKYCQLLDQQVDSCAHFTLACVAWVSKSYLELFANYSLFVKIYYPFFILSILNGLSSLLRITRVIANHLNIFSLVLNGELGQKLRWSVQVSSLLDHNTFHVVVSIIGNLKCYHQILGCKCNRCIRVAWIRFSWCHVFLNA